MDRCRYEIHIEIQLWSLVIGMKRDVKRDIKSKSVQYTVIHAFLGLKQ